MPFVVAGEAAAGGRTADVGAREALRRRDSDLMPDGSAAGGIRCPHAGRAARRRADHPSDRIARSEDHARRLKNQIDETIELCRQRVEKQERVLVTTLTKRTAEDLSDYLRDVGLKVRYLHSDIDTIERVEILRGLRAAEFDILVGINLLREGLDLPEVSLVCILDADKEGFLRIADFADPDRRPRRAAHQRRGRSLCRHRDAKHAGVDLDLGISPDQADGIQRKARHHAADRAARAVQESLHTILRGREIAASVIHEAGGELRSDRTLRELEDEMQRASANLEFERAALLRDQIMEVKSGTGLTKIEPKRRPVKYTRNNGRRRSRV